MSARDARPDYYDILKVPVWAETDEIRTSYKRLALMHHPDKNPNNPNATAIFQSVRSYQLRCEKSYTDMLPGLRSRLPTLPCPILSNARLTMVIYISV